MANGRAYIPGQEAQTENPENGECGVIDQIIRWW